MMATEKVIGIGQRYKSLILLIISTTLFISIVAILMPQKPVPYPDYIVESTSPTGTKGIYTVFEKYYSHVEVWKKPVEGLPPLTSSQLMIMVSPYRSFTNDENNKWMDWMRAGNQILLVTNDPKDFFQIKTTSYEIWDTESPQSIFYQNNKMQTYQGVITSDVRINQNPKDQLILRDQYGTLAISRQYGKGKLTVLLAPDWLTNGGILEYNHLEMVLLLINQSNAEVIWMNDYIHGYKNRPTVLEVYPDWFLFLLAQIGIILFLWLWYKGRRFGPIVLPREWVVRYGDEQIQANATWYLRGEFYKEGLSIQRDYLYHLTQEKWNVPFHLDEREWIVKVLHYIPTERHPIWKQYWDEFMLVMGSEKISYKDFDKWSKRLDALRKEVENR